MQSSEILRVGTLRRAQSGSVIMRATRLPRQFSTFVSRPCEASAREEEARLFLHLHLNSNVRKTASRNAKVHESTTRSIKRNVYTCSNEGRCTIARGTHIRREFPRLSSPIPIHEIRMSFPEPARPGRIMMNECGKMEQAVARRSPPSCSRA